ncbi:MAG: hypothetical protein H0V92_04815 [Pseudonocardiales bacterium]|nr:hypothetical protein [Pseudonocardiales bacterium]
MRRFENWLQHYAEGLVALSVAIVVGLLSVFDLLGANSNVVNAAILLTLALLAVSLLRDRSSVATALQKAAPVRQLRGYELGQALTAARRQTSSWSYKGGTGGHLRTVTLPKLVEAQRKQGSLQVRLEILDPTNVALCEEYARFRNSLDPGSRTQDWTADDIRVEAYATILAACWHWHRSDSLKLGLSLSRTVSTFRWDLSASHGIQSQEDPSGAILTFDHGQPYYAACERELRTSFDHARQVPIDRATECRLGKKPTPEEVRTLFELLNLPSAFARARTEAIITTAFGRRAGGDQPPRGAGLKRLGSQLQSYAEGLLALSVAIVFGLLTVLDVLGADNNVVNAAILLTLALLAVTLLRDRASVAKVVKKAASVRLVTGPDVGLELEKARRQTQVWNYKGVTGGHLRTVTLPGSVRQAQQEGWGSLELRLEIVDPTEDVPCEEYARFRNSLVPSAGQRKEEWTADRVRVEAYATILAACWHKQRFSPLSLGIGLSRVISTFRWDISIRHAIQSREDPSAPSLVFNDEQPYHRACQRELARSFDQARQVPIDRAKDHHLSDEPTLEEVRKLFALLGLDLPRSFPDNDVRAIIRKALAEQNAFG